MSAVICGDVGICRCFKTVLILFFWNKVLSVLKTLLVTPGCIFSPAASFSLRYRVSVFEGRNIFRHLIQYIK